MLRNSSNDNDASRLPRVSCTLTRIELRYALTVDYDELDRVMAECGFQRFYVVGKKKYHLPCGTYMRYGSEPSSDLQLAAEAVHRCGKKSASIFIGLLSDTAAAGLRTTASE